MAKKGVFLGKCWDWAYEPWLRRRQRTHLYLALWVILLVFSVNYNSPTFGVPDHMVIVLDLLVLALFILFRYLASLAVDYLSGRGKLPEPLPPIRFYTRGLLYPGKPMVGRNTGMGKGRKKVFIPYADIVGIYLSRQSKKDVADTRKSTGLVVMTVSGEFFEVPMLFKNTCHGWLERGMREEELEKVLENGFFRGRLPWYLESALGMLWVGTRVEGSRGF